MFSLNSINTQNQILVSFSQLSARYSSVFRHRKHSYGKNKDVKRKENAALAYDATICKESFEEALRHLNKDVIVEMKKVDIRSLASSPRLSRDTERCLSPRKISYISSDSFEKNKNGWAAFPPSRKGFASFTEQFVGLLSHSFQQRSLDIQVRGFKTERSVHADMKRNPNLMNRLRKFFGQYK